MLSRYSRAMACVRRYSKRAGRRGGRPCCVARLERPADERREAAGLVLQLPQALEVLDALGAGLDVAEHHRAGRPAAELVPDAMDFEPFVGQALVDRDAPARTRSTRISPPPPGRLPMPAALSRCKHLAQRQLVELVEVPDFRRAEGVQVHLRIACLQVAQQLLVPLQLQRRVIAALHQDLVAAEGDRLLDLLVQLFARQHVGVGVARSCGRTRRSRTPRRRRWCS